MLGFVYWYIFIINSCYYSVVHSMNLTDILLLTLEPIKKLLLFINSITLLDLVFVWLGWLIVVVLIYIVKIIWRDKPNAKRD